MKNAIPSRISMRDLARHLGVSHVTISLSLRDHPRISPQTRSKVRQAATDLGYQPDPMLHALARYRLNKISRPVHSCLAWIDPWPPKGQESGYKEFDQYWKGAKAAAENLGYRLERFQLGGGTTPARLHKILTTRGIAGILLPPHTHHPDWGNFPWKHHFVVRFGRSLSEPSCNLVTANQVSNSMLAFRKIRELGYRRIGFVTDEQTLLHSGHLFDAGFQAAQRLVTGAERVPPCVLADPSASARAPVVAGWVKTHRIDAIFTDQANLPSVLELAGIRVPRDIGLAATTVLDTSISSGIDQHPEEIGRDGLTMLNSLILARTPGIPDVTRESLVNGSWVDGPSMPRKSRPPEANGSSRKTAATAIRNSNHIS